MSKNALHRSLKRVAAVAVLTVTAGLAAPSAFNLAYSSEKPEPGDIGRGAKAWAENCTRCHNARDPREFRDDLWKPIMYHMRVRAGLTGQQTRDILEYIQQSN